MPSHKKHHHHHHKRSQSLPNSNEGDQEGEIFVDAQEEVSQQLEVDNHHGEDGSGNRNHDGGNAYAVDDVGGISQVNDDGIPHQFHASEKIVRLKQLNDSLAKEVSSYRFAQSELDAKVRALEVQVQANAARVDALVIEKNWLEEEKHRSELEAAVKRKEVANLGLEKAALFEEKEALILQKTALQTELHDMEAKNKIAMDQLQENQNVLASAELNASMVMAGARHLREEQGRLLQTMKAVEARKKESQNALNDLQEKKCSLEERIGQYEDSISAAGKQIEESNRVMATLKAELSSRALERYGFEMQLTEAMKQIANLEAQREDRAAHERSLESQLKSLEEELAHARMEHKSVTEAVKQAREDKASVECQLEAASSSSRDLELHLDSLKTSKLRLEADSGNHRQHLLSLEHDLMTLTEEKRLLEQTKAALERELQALNEGSVIASSKAKHEIEKLQNTMIELEKALVDAIENVSQHDKNVNLLEGNIQQLNCLVKKREKLAKMSLPLAIASSGSLIMLGISALLRRSKQQ